MQDFVQKLSLLGTKRLLVALVGFIVVFFSVYIFFNNTNKSYYETLIKNIDTREISRIATALDGINIKYQISENSISVESNSVARARMELANLGLPSFETVGYELFDKSDIFGVTGSAQEIYYIRAIEGELARSISTLKPVYSARVHLVMPKKQFLKRAGTKASASVILKLGGAYELDRAQINAIKKLVSSAVLDLDSKNVAVIDQNGNLLDHDHDNTDSVNVVEKMRLQQQHNLTKNIENMLEKVVGKDKVIAEVVVDLDYKSISENSEIFDPDTQVIKSRDRTEHTNSASENKDHHGGNTISNATIDAILDSEAADEINRTSDQKTSEKTTYDNSRIVRSTNNSVSTIKRLSVAVLIDGHYKKVNDQDEYIPRSDDEMEKITNLVKSAVGFDEEREDTIEVINMQFVQQNDEYIAPANDVITKAFVYEMAVMLLPLLFCLLGIFAIRPVILGLLEIKKHQQQQDAIADKAQNKSYEDDDITDNLADKINRAVKQKIDGAVDILRSWMK